MRVPGASQPSINDVTSAHGAAAPIISIMLWICCSSLILLFGAEFTKAQAETHGSRA
ncbi:hypothetical protein [Rubellimicrobium aerolatum]|uniref:Uncharacterized protein n=1 Tax=Rubellimicrobium aerolatum TaxID=490979 RepID=A0ABW0SAD2_9RHOB|nr:hypothetical protein [Rubellimicrobium aerolatum]MBP1805244.1 uncharacterized BrkB/YihY/UPF0761 family membrane protein [Rubellimicrobium aerolatum]